ncbi:MAG: Gfo/Idh/MocA family oxidoreductase [Verrucomicrobia bacterium]|nr:Gfo/Idh/MocA family oxidoreductase [Verrucomicrobiota bacterium]MBV8481240.1 Gfo/Idh/MocA family oxidoreductase [Verrucomicrobiota bacterium]
MGFAVVGCGLIGQRRAAAVPPGTLLYACDLDLSRAEQVGRQHQGCIPTDRFEQALESKEVTAVIVSTVNSVLAPITLAAVKSGKDVLVEKPAAIRAADLEEIEKNANLSGSLVRIGYNHRYHPSFLKARELIVQEQLGDPFLVRGRYGHGGRRGYDREWRADPKLSGGGELIDQGVHLIDLAGSFLGEWAQVDGHASTYYWDMPVDDNAFLNLRTADGRTAWLHVSCSEWKNLFCFEIYFRHAKLQIDGLGGSYGTERLSYYRMLPEMGPPETTIFEFPRGDQSWAHEVKEFVTDIEQQRQPRPGIAEAKSVLRVVETIYSTSGFGRS